MTALLRRDDGIALITAMLVMFVVVIFATVVVATSAFDVNQSGTNRTRTQAVAVAEAGLNDTFAVIAKAAPSTLPCSQTGTVTSTPMSGTFQATVTYSDELGTPYTNFCATDPAVRPTPAQALIMSIGTVGGSSRTMQTAMDLKPIFGGFNMAMFADTLLTAGQGATVEPALTGEPGDIYTNGHATITNSATISGSIYAQQTVTLQNNGQIGGNVWAGGNIQIDNPRQVLGNVTSATGNILGSGSVNGNLLAGGTISPSLTVSATSTKTPNTPSDPPPTQTLPPMLFEPADKAQWQAAGYSVEEFGTCATAKAHIATMPVGSPPTVVRINAVCLLDWNNETVTVRNNLAIIHNGSFRLQGGSGVVRGVGSPADNPWTFQLITVTQTPQNCASGSYNITKQQAVSFNNIRVFLYTPCHVSLEQSTTLVGQVIAGSISWTQSLKLTYYQHTVFGSRHVIGFDQDIRYIREVR